MASSATSAPQRYVVGFRRSVSVDRNLRIIWLNDKIHIWCESRRRLWWMRCDHCLTAGHQAFALSRRWSTTLNLARQHAAIRHNVHL